MKRALITGISGQDGAYLSQYLIGRGYKVFGTVRRVSSPTNLWRLSAFNLLNTIDLIPADMTDPGSILRALQIARPDEVYNLAAQSFVKASFEMPGATAQVDALGVLNVLEAVRLTLPQARLYMASSSEMWGNNLATINDEDATLLPASPYGVSKVFGHHLARIYREGYGMYVVSGILTNHNSPMRGLEFASRKITNYVGQLFVGRAKNKLQLGNLEPLRENGYAPAYVEAMWLMLQQKTPDDFVIATGDGRSVKQFIDRAFSIIGEDWNDHVEVVTSEIRPLDIDRVVGDPRKAKEILGWQHPISHDELVQIMVHADINRWKRYVKGETFPWDVLP